jgi:hypothetical protein
MPNGLWRRGSPSIHLRHASAGHLRRLLEAVLAGTPRLSGALCAGYPDVFDAPDGKFDDDTPCAIAFAQSCCRYTSPGSTTVPSNYTHCSTVYIYESGSPRPQRHRWDRPMGTAMRTGHYRLPDGSVLRVDLEMGRWVGTLYTPSMTIKTQIVGSDAAVHAWAADLAA